MSLPDDEWNRAEAPVDGAIVRVLASDDHGEDAIPFPVTFRSDGSTPPPAKNWPTKSSSKDGGPGRRNDRAEILLSEFRSELAGRLDEASG